MVRALKTLAKRFKLKSFGRGDMTSAPVRPVENLDVIAAEHSSPFPATFPPGYVKSYDEGRPRH